MRLSICRHTDMARLHFLKVILLCYLVTCSNSCSMLTHIEVATRAFSFFSFSGFEEFKPLIQKHLSTYQAGATFPDWGYPRAGFHQAAEIAHWPPFYLTAAEYIQKKYPQPWTEEAEILAVFLVGATTHMVADVAWHSLLNVTQGFIISMSSYGFDYDYDAAHSIADLGGDTVLAVQNDLEYVLVNWSIPIKDIVEIYHMSGWTNVTELVLTESIGELYAGTMALKEGGAEVLFPKYASKSAFMQDQFEDYFIGGLDDMAVWTTYCWPYVMGWFVNGPGKTPSICLMMTPAMPTDPSLVNQHTPEWRFSHFPEELEPMKKDILKSMTTESAVEGHTSLSWSGAAKKRLPPKPVDELAVASRTTIYSTNDYSYLGYDIVTADLNADSFTDLIISAPGYSNATIGKPQMGCVYFLFGSTGPWPTLVDIESIANFTLCGNDTHDRFGHSIEVLDFNKDGIMDVAISSPTSGSLQMAYVGTTWTTSAKPNVTIVGDWYSNLGSTIISGDVNADGYPDLIVGCPYAPKTSWLETGYVVIFYASSNYAQDQLLSLDQADLFLNAPIEFQKGVADHGWWGISLLYVPASASSSTPYLIVGGSGNTWLNSSFYLSESGSISIFSLDGSHFTRPIVVFYGNANERLGATLALGSMPEVDKSGPALSVSLTLMNATVFEAGQVAVLSFAKILQFASDWATNSTEWILPFTALSSIVATRINGDQVFAHFGSIVSFVDFVQSSKPAVPTFFVGYPLWTFNITEEGCVCMWESGAFPLGNVNTPVVSASRVYTSPITSGLTMNKDGRFGSALAFGDIEGDGNTDIVFGSNRKSLYSYLGGAVEILFSSSL